MQYVTSVWFRGCHHIFTLSALLAGSYTDENNNWSQIFSVFAMWEERIFSDDFVVVHNIRCSLSLPLQCGLSVCVFVTNKWLNR